MLVVPASGSIVSQHLAHASWGLLLACADEGTAMWISSDGLAWRQLRLPRAMVEGIVTSLKTAGPSRVVATLHPKNAPGHQRYATVDGTHWTPA
jgi:hypothetical protein